MNDITRTSKELSTAIRAALEERPVWNNAYAATKFGSLLSYALGEIERLAACLAEANANHERFEREWYLRGDQIERLQRHVSELEAERNALGHFVELNADMIVHGIAACVTADELPEPPAVQPSNQDVKRYRFTKSGMFTMDDGQWVSWVVHREEIERLRQRVAELEPYQARTERLCNLIMGLNPNEGLSSGALSGLQRMAEAAKRASTPPAAELAAGIEWLKQEICDGEEYLQRYPNSVDELAQQEHRQRLLDAITGSAQPPIDARVHPDTHLIDSLGMRSTLNDIAARADSTKSACCRQSPCLHPGVGPCDMPAVEKPESPEPGRSQSSGLSASPDAENIGRPSHDESQCWEPCGALGKSEEHARVATEKSEKRPHSAWYSSVCGGFSCHTCGAHAESVAAILAVEADCTKRCVSSMVKPADARIAELEKTLRYVMSDADRGFGMPDAVKQTIASLMGSSS